MENVSSGHKYFSSVRIAVIAMFAALAGVLYIFGFPMPFAFPAFLDFKFSDVPVLIGAFALGPVSAAIIVVVQILIKLVAVGTSTSFVGELSDLMTCCAFSVTAGIIYSKKRTFKGALLSLGVGMLCEVCVALLMNWLVLIPFYVDFMFKGSWAPLLGMMTPLFPNCTQETFFNFYLWATVLPFNLLRCLVAALITLAVYKRISIILNRFNAKMQPKHEGDAAASKKASIIAIICAVAVIAVLVLFALLRFFVFKK